MSNKRVYPRTMMKARIKITHPELGEVFGYPRDLSDGGVFVENASWPSWPPVPRSMARCRTCHSKRPCCAWSSSAWWPVKAPAWHSSTPERSAPPEHRRQQYQQGEDLQAAQQHGETQQPFDSGGQLPV